VRSPGGKAQYASILSWRDRDLADRWSAAVVALVRAAYPDALETWAMLASLIETCKLHGINPEAYLTDVPAKLVNNRPNNRLDEFLPWASDNHSKGAQETLPSCARPDCSGR